MNHRNKLLIILFTLFILSSLTVTGCSNTGGEMETSNLKMASMADMPDQVRAAPVTVQQAYQFAAANPDVLTQLPCYCGCGAIGHTSNYDCYVSGTGLSDGLIAYDTHALGCSICVDITQDAMRMLEQGKPVNEIRSFVDETYAQYGPSNMP